MNLGKYRVKESIGDIETHEVFLDTLAHAKEKEMGLSEKKFEVKIREKAIYFIFSLFFILVFALFAKTFYLQVFLGHALRNVAENNKGKISIIRPERGIIYDSNFKKMVINSPAYDLVCDKRSFTDLNKSSEEISTLSKIMGKDYESLLKQITESADSNVLISENISHESLLVLDARAGEIPNCQIEKNTVRNYVAGKAFSHILGYNGRINNRELESVVNYAPNDYIGKTGLERFYEKDLRGVPGKTEVIRNASGIQKGNQVISEPEEGNNLVLNIDLDLQRLIYNSLEKKLKDIGAKKGAAVVMDPRSGAVLALVSYPSYDNNLFSTGISKKDFDEIANNPYQPLFNRAISAQYPTGSIIKPLEAAAALQEKIISPDKQINDPGYILIHSQYDPSVTYRFGGVTPHGWVDMRKAIAVSSNIYFYTVGGGYEEQKGLGPTKIKQYLSEFGWNQKTGIDLPGEFSGFIPDPAWKKQTRGQGWWDGDTYNLSIGQSDLQTTPLQVAAAYSAIANGGTLYKPQLVKKIVDNSKTPNTIYEPKPEILNQNFIDEENLQVAREGMRDAVSKPYGLSALLNNLPVKVAAKTGTAQIPVANRYNLWSAAFAPYDNPEIVIVVTAEEVNALGAVTLPVAHDALNWYFSPR